MFSILRLRRCRSSLLIRSWPVRMSCGRPAIGFGTQAKTTGCGCAAFGCMHRADAVGFPVTGASSTTAGVGFPAPGPSIRRRRRIHLPTLLTLRAASGTTIPVCRFSPATACGGRCIRMGVFITTTTAARPRPPSLHRVRTPPNIYRSRFRLWRRISTIRLSLRRIWTWPRFLPPSPNHWQARSIRRNPSSYTPRIRCSLSIPVRTNMPSGSLQSSRPRTWRRRFTGIRDFKPISRPTPSVA